MHEVLVMTGGNQALLSLCCVHMYHRYHTSSVYLRNEQQKSPATETRLHTAVVHTEELAKPPSTHPAER